MPNFVHSFKYLKSLFDSYYLQYSLKSAPAGSSSPKQQWTLSPERNWAERSTSEVIIENKRHIFWLIIKLLNYISIVISNNHIYNIFMVDQSIEDQIINVSNTKLVFWQYHAHYWSSIGP